MEYKKHTYEIQFCNPKDYTGKERGLFRIDMAMPTGGLCYTTYAEAEEKAKNIIDTFIEEIPQTKEQWLAVFENCMVWSGYEDCHLDENMVLCLLEKAAKHFKTESKE